MITATMKNKKNKTGFNLFVKYNLNDLNILSSMKNEEFSYFYNLVRKNVARELPS